MQYLLFYRRSHSRILEQVTKLLNVPALSRFFPGQSPRNIPRCHRDRLLKRHRSAGNDSVKNRSPFDGDLDPPFGNKRCQRFEDDGIVRYDRKGELDKYSLCRDLCAFRVVRELFEGKEKAGKKGKKT